MIPEQYLGLLSALTCHCYRVCDDTEPRYLRMLSVISSVLPQALKGTRTVDKYRLIWSPRPEFVRAAAKFGATIIPFGAVGAEDQVQSIMNPETLAKLFPQDPAQVARQEKAAERLQARKGVNREGMSDSLSSVRHSTPLENEI